MSNTPFLGPPQEGDTQSSGRITKMIGILRALRKLELERNMLSESIPKAIGDLCVLEVLSLSNNKLNGPIPKEIGRLNALKVLQLDDNKLSGPIPTELGNLGALETLSLNWNQLIGQIPAALGNLSRLKMLDLSWNKLSGVIPMELGRLTLHVGLYISNNNISAIWNHAQDVQDGTRLQEHPDGCAPQKLVDWLAWLSDLSSRGKLGLSGNQWEEPPENVVEDGMQAVSDYFFDVYAEGITVQRTDVKVVLIGQEGAGKTSLRQSISARTPTPTAGPEESTVQLDVEEIILDGVSLRIYDCAGQVAYTGLLQMFLTPRAVSLLVCDVGAFGERNSAPRDNAQLFHDVQKLEELRVWDWMRSLSFRIPDSEAVIVATKCDLVPVGMTADIAGRVERAIRQWLVEWRKIGMADVCVDKGVSLTSCLPAATATEGRAGGAKKQTRDSTNELAPYDWRNDGRNDPPKSLLHRIVYKSNGNPRGGSMVLPRSWNIALVVLSALENGRDPVASVRQQILSVDERGVLEQVVETAEEYKGITVPELLTKWADVVGALRRDGVEVINADHALKGALSIRDHQGSLIRHEKYIFLDVTWLAAILKPLLNHMDMESPFDGSVSLGETEITLTEEEDILSWQKLKKHGILEPALARAMWPARLSDYVLPTLEWLGLTFPLEGDSADGLVVLLRLDEERPDNVGRELDSFRRSHTAALSVQWKIFQGVPPGAVEKALTLCCRVGAIQIFWRYGVLIQGGLGGGGIGKTFAMLIEYSRENTEIDIMVYGNIETLAPWAALAHGLSVFRMMCLDFPGLRWRASLKCPQHEDEAMPITREATRYGDKFVRDMRCNRCSVETGGLGQAAKGILEMVDVRQSKDELLQGMNERFKEWQARHPKKARGIRDEEEFELRVEALMKELKDDVNALSTRVGSDLTRALTCIQQQQERLTTQVAQGQEGMKDLLEDFIAADNGVAGKVDLMVAMLMTQRGEGVDCPRQACVLPPWAFKHDNNLTEEEQAPSMWKKRFQDWKQRGFNDGKGMFKTKMRLFLVCAHTHRLVPSGPKGQGYDIQRARKWLRTTVAVMQFAISVTLDTLALIPAATLPVVSAATALASSFAVEHSQPGLQGQVEKNMLVDCGEVPELKGDKYELLRKFVLGEECTAQLEISARVKKAYKRNCIPPDSSDFVFFERVMVKVQAPVGDAAVQWVLAEHENAWYDANR